MKHSKSFIIIVFFLFLSLPLHAENTYFPDKIFLPDRPDMHKSMSDWYCKHLKVLEEPSIYQQKSDKDKNIIRFTWLRTFDKPVVIRVEINDNGSGTLNIKMSDGAGGYKPGKIILNEKKEITKERVSAIIKFIENIHFWNLPSRVERRGFDGSEWITELLLNGKYHLVNRWTPESGPIRELGLQFIGLSELKVEEIY